VNAVEESRLLQVTIFSMLHKDVKVLDFDMLLPDVVTKLRMRSMRN
jgi:hypothetical protein